MSSKKAADLLKQIVQFARVNNRFEAVLKDVRSAQIRADNYYRQGSTNQVQRKFLVHLKSVFLCATFVVSG